MGILTANLGVPTVTGVLTALKNLLGSGWTYNADEQAVWKSSPSAFPVGFAIHESHLTGAVKCNGVIVKTSDGGIGLSDSPSKMTVYVSPNGSVGVTITESASTGFAWPKVLIARNSNTNQNKPFDLVLSATNGGNGQMLSPLRGAVFNGIPQVTPVSGTDACVLTQLADPFVGVGLKDVYMLLSSYSSAPDILSNSGQKYVQFNYNNTYLRCE